MPTPNIPKSEDSQNPPVAEIEGGIDSLGTAEQAPDTLAVAAISAEIRHRAAELVLEHGGDSISLDDRIRILTELGDKEKLVNLAKELLVSNPEKAIEVMQSSGSELTPEQIQETGDRLIAEDKLPAAMRFYKKANLPPEKIEVIGKALLEKARNNLLCEGGRQVKYEDVGGFEELHKAVHGRSPSAEEWKQLGESADSKGQYWSAVGLYVRSCSAMTGRYGANPETMDMLRATLELKRRAEIRLVLVRYVSGSEDIHPHFIANLEKLNDAESLRLVRDCFEQKGEWHRALELRDSKTLKKAGDPEPDRAWFEKAVKDGRDDALFVDFCKRGGMTEQLVAVGSIALEKAESDFDPEHPFGDYGEVFMQGTRPRLQGQRRGVSNIKYALDCFTAANYVDGFTKVAEFLIGHGLVFEAYGIIRSNHLPMPTDPRFFEKLGKIFAQRGDTANSNEMFVKMLELQGSTEKPQAEIAK